MRIISGSFKGKKIFEPKDKNTRPLKDLTKESIFNSLKHSNKFVCLTLTVGSLFKSNWFRSGPFDDLVLELTFKMI